MSSTPTTYDLIWQLRSAAIVANQAADRLEALTNQQPPALDPDGIIEACAKVAEATPESDRGGSAGNMRRAELNTAKEIAAAIRAMKGQ